MSLRCKLGLHKGGMKTQNEISQEIEGRSAFVCNRCGKVIE